MSKPSMGWHILGANRNRARQFDNATTAEHQGGTCRLMVEMPPNKPLFSVGNSVYEKFPLASAKGERGTVIEAYELDDQYRYVVKFESGREEVFFENELITDRGKPD